MWNVSILMNLTTLDSARGNSSTVEDTCGVTRTHHGYISVIVCVVGIIGNIFNFTIWSRQRKHTPTNFLLAALAVADLVTLLFYLIFASYFFLATGPLATDNHTKSGMVSVVVCFHIFITFASLSSWITISLAIFRYIKVCKISLSKTYFNLQKAKMTVLIVCILTALTSIPFYFYYEVYELEAKNTQNNATISRLYWVRKTNFAETHEVSYQTTILWLYGVFVKVVPSCALVIFSSKMIYTLRRAKKRRKKIKQSIKGYNRTTVMLLVILFIYIINQMTIGVSAFISALRGGGSHFFYFLIYSEVGDYLDLTTILNSALNFLVYISISLRFREMFSALISRICRCKS